MTRRLRQLIPCVLLLFLVACGAREDDFLRESVLVDTPSVASGDSSPSRGSSEDELTAPEQNHYADLSVPTCVTKVGDLYFIVDCYHDQVIYNDSLEDPVAQWSMLPTGMPVTDGTVPQSPESGDRWDSPPVTSLNQPHTIASDGVVYLVDDTENNRVVVYEKMSSFTLTQYFDDIGVRPHFTVYDEPTKTFYVWSSFSGEMYLFKRRESDNRVLLTDIKKVPELAGVYVRSFTIAGDRILFVSGLAVADEVYAQAAAQSDTSSTASGPPSPQGEGQEQAHGQDLLPLQERATGVILSCDKKTFEVKERYPVPDELAGMVQIMKVTSGYLITVSTDRVGNAAAGTILFCERLEDLASGDYVEVYDTHFIGGGTPYYMGLIDGAYYLTEHRIPGHSIWRFNIQDQQIANPTLIY